MTDENTNSTSKWEKQAEEWGWPKRCGSLYQTHLEQKKGKMDFDDPFLAELSCASFWLMANLDNRSNDVHIETGIISQLTNTAEEELDLRKYTRELFQNAFDSFTGEQEGPLFFRIELSENNLRVYHNGKPFVGPSPRCPTGEMGALSQIGVTSKKLDFDLEGQFGIGFKGWSMFYKDVKVACCDPSDPSRSCRISWEVGPTYIQLNGLENGETGWGIEGLHRKFANLAEDSFGVKLESPITTMYQFGEYYPDPERKPLPTIENLEEELKGLTRFRNKSILVQIVVGERQSDLKHIAEEGPIPDSGYEGFRLLEFTNTIHRDGQKSSESKFVGVRIPIDPHYRLSDPVDTFISSMNDKYRNRKVDNNPWKEVSSDDWFEKKSIIVGLRANQGQHEEAPSRHWMYSMAPIHESTVWTPGKDGKLQTTSPWVIDSPFWLAQNRLRLSSTEEHRHANAMLVKQAIYSGVPLLVGNSGHDPETVYRKTPFDDFLLDHCSPDEHNDWRLKPFQEIFWRTIGNTSKWQIKPYREIFSSGIFTGFDKKIIEVGEAVRIPDSWILEESGEKLSSWLNRNMEFDESWSNVIFTHSSGTPKLATEKTSSFVKTVPDIPSTRIYELLEESGKLVPLLEGFPSLKSVDWLHPPIDEGDCAYIFADGPPPLGAVTDFLWERCKEEGVKIAPPKARESMDPSQEWEEKHGIYVVAIPQESEEAVWVDRMIEILGSEKLDAFTESQLNELSNKGVNSIECSWFIARVQYAFPEDFDAIALLRRSITRERGYSLCLRTTTGWIKSKEAGTSVREKEEPAGRSSNLKIIDDSKNVIFPHDSDAIDYIENVDKVTLLPGSGIIPKSILAKITDLYCKFRQVEWTNGRFLMVNEHEREAAPKDSMTSDWAKIPNLIITRNTKEVIHPNGVSNLGQIGAKTNFNSMFTKPNRVRDGIKAHIETQVGHALGLHRELKKHNDTSALVQDLEIERLSDLDGTAELSTVLKINNALGSRQASGIFIYWGKKENQQDNWNVKQYEILPIKDLRITNPRYQALYSGGHEYFSEVRNQPPSFGFREPESPVILDWIPELGPSPPVEAPNELFEVEIGEIHKAIQHRSAELGAKEELFRGIAEYLARFAEKRDALSTEDLSWLCEYLERTSTLVGVHDGGIEGLFSQYSDKISLTADTREGLMGLIEDQQTTSEQMSSLKAGLESLEVLDFDKLQGVISNLEPDEGWRRFTEAKLIQKNSSHRFIPDQDQFRSSTATKFIGSGKNRMFLASKDDARDVFNISLDHDNEDAVAWRTDELTRTVILNENLEEILKAEGAKGSVSGKFDFEGLQAQIEDSAISDLPSFTRSADTARSRPPTTEDFERPWDYFRLILSLWGLSKAPESLRDQIIRGGEISLCPISIGPESESCQIFLDGPDIKLGKNGWDLRHMANPPFVELVTSEGGTAQAKLRNITLMCERAREIGTLFSCDLNTEKGIRDVAFQLKIHEDLVSQLVAKVPGEILNPTPYSNEGYEQWIREHATQPKWREASLKVLDYKEAKRLLKSYDDALTQLLLRGPSGARSDSDLQKNLQALVMSESGGPDGRGEFERTLYRGVHSMLADEPRLAVSSNAKIRRMFIARRYPRKGESEYELIENAKLSSFPGNVLLLSSFSQNLALNYGQQWGLKPTKGRTLGEFIRSMLRRESDWGVDEHILIRGCMEAEGQLLDLKVHKYHAIMIAALDHALEEAQKVK